MAANSIVKRPGFQVTAELLTKQRFNVGFVVNDEDINAQFLSPPAAAVRGSVIMNSVNSPGIVSTSI